VSAASIEMIWSHWRRRPGSIVVPGHDVPMVLEGGAPRYIGARTAALAAWFGENLANTTPFDLTRHG
jgi:hypothetical protein